MKIIEVLETFKTGCSNGIKNLLDDISTKQKEIEEKQKQVEILKQEEQQYDKVIELLKKKY
jgi:hypothetical protein